MNNHAAAVADQELATRHPGLVDPMTGKLRPLTMKTADDAYRKEWLLYYKHVDKADKELRKNGFTTQDVGGTKVLCPRVKEWTQLEVLKILCKEEPWVIKVLQHPLATTKRIGRILYVDKKYNIDAMGNPVGDPIDVRVFPGGGSNQWQRREINVLSKDSAEEVASTFVHEAHHQVQDRVGLKARARAAGVSYKEMVEIDAYEVGEQYRIKRGLPEFAKNFRMPTGKMIKDPRTGKMVPEMVPRFDGIKAYVKKEYPVEPEWFPGEEIDEGIEDVSKGWDCTKIP